MLLNFASNTLVFTDCKHMANPAAVIAIIMIFYSQEEFAIITEESLKNPHIRFYKERNPDFLKVL